MRLRAAAMILASGMLVACGGHGGETQAKTPGHDGPAIDVPEVSDDAFAASLRDALLAEPSSPARIRLLAGVEARQMDRAVQRFRTKEGSAGLRSVTGGLLLLHPGELRAGMLGASGALAMKLAAHELATRGDEGRARAAYEILSRMGSGAESDDAKTHLDALSSWVKNAVATGGPLSAAGALEQVAVRRSLVEPSEVARNEAARATVEWISRALTLRSNFRENRVPPSREEGTEAVRALDTGGAVLAALYIVRGDAKGALNALNQSHATELVHPELIKALEATDGAKNAQPWLDVMRLLRPSSDDQAPRDEEEALEDRDLLRAAALGAAVEAYRLDHTDPEAAGVLASSLEELGMGEAAPILLADAVKAHPDGRMLALSLALTLRVLESAVDAEDPDMARRTFRAASSLLATADASEARPNQAEQIEPSPARVRAFMGEIELREGHLKEARALLQQAATAEKTAPVLLSIARIDQHDGNVSGAKGDLDQALASDDAKSDPVMRGSVLLLQSDLAREQGDLPGARAPLTDALHSLEKIRSSPDTDERSRAERVLVRVLDRFGAHASADHALDRAFDAAQRNKEQTSAAVALGIERAVVHGDLASAHRVLQRALAADLEDDDLVYYALCVRLLEKQSETAKNPHARNTSTTFSSDSAAERELSSAIDNGRWTGKLAQFGSGLITGDVLVTAAKTPAQRTEALFYAALAKRSAGDSAGAAAGFASVLKADGVDLLEVAAARDLVEGPKAELPGPPPAEAAAP